MGLLLALVGGGTSAVNEPFYPTGTSGQLAIGGSNVASDAFVSSLVKTSTFGAITLSQASRTNLLTYSDDLTQWGNWNGTPVKTTTTLQDNQAAAPAEADPAPITVPNNSLPYTFQGIVGKGTALAAVLLSFRGGSNYTLYYCINTATGAYVITDGGSTVYGSGFAVDLGSAGWGVKFTHSNNSSGNTNLYVILAPALFSSWTNGVAPTIDNAAQGTTAFTKLMVTSGSNGWQDHIQTGATAVSLVDYSYTSSGAVTLGQTASGTYAWNGSGVLAAANLVGTINGSSSASGSVALSTNIVWGALPELKSATTANGKVASGVSVQAGDTILVAFQVDATLAATTIADNAAGGSNVYTEVGSGGDGMGNPSVQQTLRVFTATAKATETLTITATNASANFPATIVHVVKGLQRGNTVDAFSFTVEGVAAVGGPRSYTHSPSVTATGPAYLVAFFANDSQGPEHFRAANDSVTLRGDNYTGSTNAFSADRRASSAGAYSLPMVGDITQPYLIFTGAFKAASSGISATSSASGTIGLSTAIKLAANALMSAAASIILSTGITLAAQGTSSAQGTVALTTQVQLAANGAGKASGTADVLTAIQLAANGSSVATGTLALTAAPASGLGPIPGTSSSSGVVALTTQIKLAAAGTVQAQGTADLTSFRLMQASGAGQAQGTATLTTAVKLAANGVSGATGLVTINATPIWLINGYGQATATVALSTGAKALAASGTSSATGALALTIPKPLAASGASQATGTAVLTIPKPLAASGVSQASGTTALTSAIKLAASGTSQASGTVDLLTLAPGAVIQANGASRATGTVALTAAIQLPASGVVSATGSVQLTSSIKLAAAGSSSATGAVNLSTGAKALAAAGTSRSTASVQLTMQADMAADGTAGSTGSVQLDTQIQLAAAGSSSAQGTVNVSKAGEMRVAGAGRATGTVALSTVIQLRAAGTSSARGVVKVISAPRASQPFETTTAAGQFVMGNYGYKAEAREPVVKQAPTGVFTITHTTK